MEKKSVEQHVLAELAPFLLSRLRSDGDGDSASINSQS